MTKEEALKKLSELNLMNKEIVEKNSGRQYKIIHVSESKELDSDEHYIQIAMEEISNDLITRNRVEKYQTVINSFRFL